MLLSPARIVRSLSGQLQIHDAAQTTWNWCHFRHQVLVIKHKFVSWMWFKSGSADTKSTFWAVLAWSTIVMPQHEIVCRMPNLTPDSLQKVRKEPPRLPATGVAFAIKTSLSYILEGLPILSEAAYTVKLHESDVIDLPESGISQYLSYKKVFYQCL